VILNAAISAKPRDIGETPADVQKFPSVQPLLAARGTDAMPTPEVAARNLLAAFDVALTRRSGSFLDIRDLA